MAVAATGLAHPARIGVKVDLELGEIHLRLLTKVASQSDARMPPVPEDEPYAQSL